jgi:hypothetical protein
MGVISEKIDRQNISVDIDSTNLKHASYDTSLKILTITFKNGGIYEYYEFPWDEFTKFRLAESQGKFFSREIKNGSYKYKKVG